MNRFLVKHRQTLTVGLLLLITFCTQIWIFSNSLKNGEESSAQSNKVVEVVRPAAETILVGVNVEPSDSAVSHFVRKCAHFAEYALLGFLAFFVLHAWKKRRLLCLTLPVVYCALTACADEWIQLFSDGRSGQISDVLLDSAGGIAGMLFAFACLCAVSAISKRIHSSEKDRN